MGETKRLPVPLTDMERLSVGEELCANISALEREKALKKEADDGFKDRIGGFEAQVKTLKSAFESGVIEREVDVETKSDFVKGRIIVTRLDTGVVVEDRAMDEEERQMRLDGDVKKARSEERKGAPKTEEQREASTPEEAEQMRADRLLRERRERVGQLVDPVLSEAETTEAETGGFKVRVRANQPLWPSPVSTIRGTAKEALAATREKLIKIIIEAEDAAFVQRTDRVMAQLAELVPLIVVSAEAAGVFVAKVETERWVTEAEGEDQAGAVAALRVKLIAILTSEDAEIEKLAGEQKADDAKTPKLLKVPSGAKGRKTKATDEADGPDVTPPAGAAF